MAITRRLKGATAGMTALALAAIAAMLALAASATAAAPLREVTLNGDWQTFNRCPVDDPRMLAADGIKVIALCATIDSPEVITVKGVKLLETEDDNTQFGLAVKGELEEVTAVAPPGGGSVIAPANVVGGLRALICPGGGPIARNACGHRANRELETVTGTVVDTGFSEKINLFADFSIGQPIITLDYELHLRSPLLGPSCYIGSAQEPIVLELENFTPPTLFAGQIFAADGTPGGEGASEAEFPLSRFEISGMTQGDEKLSIPVAHGCGPHGQLDSEIDSKLGLPSAGGNSIVLTKSVTSLAGLSSPTAGALPDGAQLAHDWHSAVLKHGGR